MKRLIRRSASMLALLFVLGFASFAEAGIIFESGALGETGISSDDVFNTQIVPASNVDSHSYQSVRFFVDQVSLTTRVGGHFVSRPSGGGVFFGAVVRLDDASDFPDSSDLSTADVLGNTLLTFPETSDVVFGNLSLSLSPGWYALVFGAGLYGTTGDGAILRNNSDIGDPQYIGFAEGFGWGKRLPSKRLVVEGVIIPEPTSIALLLSVALLLTVQNRSHR